MTQSKLMSFEIKGNRSYEKKTEPFVVVVLFFYLQSDDVFFLFLDEERIEFVELFLEKANEIKLLLRWIRVGSGTLVWAILDATSGLQELQLLLELLVGEKFVLPFRQGLLDLVAKTLAEFHGTKEEASNHTHTNTSHKACSCLILFFIECRIFAVLFMEYPLFIRSISL